MALKEDDSKLVKVFDTERDTEAMVVKGLLDSAGIESVISSLDFPEDVLPVGGVIVQVAPDQAEDAIAIIDDYRKHPAEDSEVSEGSSA